MKLWKLKYHLEDDFDVPVRDHAFTLRCFPRETAAQRVLSLKYLVTPETAAERGFDSFGNPLLIGRIAEGHTHFGVDMEAEVQAEDSPEKEPLAEHQLGRFRYSSALTAMGPALTAFYETLPARKNEDVGVRALTLMNAVYAAFRYEPGTTGFDTTAEAAFAQGCGVCQDYAHILLSLLHRDGLLSRYVAGAIPGEGQTHAWVQVYADGLWRGFDPTHNLETGDGYLSFGVGRDAADCPVNRGIFRGNAAQTQSVLVSMEPFENSITKE